MKPNDFKIIFDSDSHEVDVETLIGCLMHTSKIIQEVNRELDTEKKIEVKIKALEKGSFEVHIQLVEKLLSSLYSNNNLSIASNIVTVVGGLYGFAKYLKGKKPKNIEEQKNGSVKITNDSGDVTIINGDVYTIYNENKIVRDSISRQFAVLNKNEDISGFKFQSDNVDVYIPEEDFDPISVKMDTLDEISKEPIREVVKDKKILIIRPSFDKDLKWDFVYEGRKISAKMEDEEIIKYIDEGEQFAKGDFMLVDIEVTQFYDADLGVHLVTGDSYKILKYKSHVKTAKTGKLF